MKTNLFFFFLFLTITCQAQEENRKPVPGTKISLIPPADFEPAANFSGFQQDKSGASIMVNEISTPLNAATASFTSENLKAKGMTLIEKKQVDWNNSKATLVKLTQPANGTTYLKQILLFGDEKRTFLINGIYPEAARSIEKEITTSLLTSRYNENQNDDAEATAAFSINIAGSEFKFAKFLGGNLLYTTDGKIPTQSPEKSLLMVASSLGNTATGDRKQFALQQLKKLPRGESTVVKETNPIVAGKLEGFETIAEGKDATGKKQLVYQAMLFTVTGEYYTILGSSTGRFDAYLESFKKIAKTFKLK